MIKAMNEALKIPHFGYSDEFTMDELISLRDSLKHEAKHRQIKLTYLPIIIKATSMALTEYPQLNAHADEKQVRYYRKVVFFPTNFFSGSRHSSNA
jgi:2-oxoisovalerate dehydrogenase E2 component (dihydrolipoyl transacylase)